MASGYKHFSTAERERLYGLLMQGHSKDMISDCLGKHRSSIYKELARNRVSIAYLPGKAERFYFQRRKKKHKLNEDSELRATVINFLKKKFSPGQIVLQLKHDLGKSPISAESIYVFIYSEMGQELGLSGYLRRKRKRRKARASCAVKKISIPCRTPISERPEEVNDRSSFGHWEGDLMIFSHQKTNLIIGIKCISSS